MRKPLSTFTAQDFAEFMSAMNYHSAAEVSAELSRTLQRRKRISPSTISRYLNSHSRIPMDVANAMHTLVSHAASKASIASRGYADRLRAVRDLNFLNNANRGKKDGKHVTADRFMNRQSGDGLNTRLLPAYTLRAQQVDTFKKALALWGKRIIELSRTNVDPPRQRDYQLEMADLKVILTTLPQHVPYTVHATVAEWTVIARALRYASEHGIPKARAIYHHWRKHKGTGYPRVRPTVTQRVTQPKEPT